MNHLQSRSTIAYLALAAVIIIFYFVLVVLLAPGAPFRDDISISDSVERARAMANPWPELWSQHNEHRPFITKLIFWAQRATSGSPNYTALAFLGNLLLIPIFVILSMRMWRGGGSTSGASVLFIAAMCFSYTAADSMLWAMAALSNYGVLLFSLLSFWMLSKKRIAWSLGSLVSALLAGISQGNGILVLILGCGCLLVDMRWRLALVWASASAAFIVVYFLNYLSDTGNSDPLESLRHPVEVIFFALVFSGSALGYPTESEVLRWAMIIACALLGLALWAILSVRLFAARFRCSDPLLWFSIFLVGSGFIAALGRLDGGIIQALTPRYHTNSCLLIAAVTVVLVTGEGEDKLKALMRSIMPLMAIMGVAYIAISTLTLWRMHTFYIEQTQL